VRQRGLLAVLLSGGAALAVGLPVAAAPSSLSFRIVGLSQSIPTVGNTDPCPEGKWSTALYAASTPRRIGTAYGCSHASATGRILKRTGHYSQVHGTIRIDGTAVDGHATYRVRI
jgi:hypothetical protein